MVGKLFTYENVRVEEDRKVVFFDYRIDTDTESFSLSEKLELPSPLPSSSTVDRLLRALHLALGIRYYKTFMPPEINHDYSMDSDEADFWNKTFRNGLGELLLENKISPEKLAKFKSHQGNISPGTQDDINWNDLALLGVGGGKDSIVAGELLKELNIPVKGFVLATASNRGQTQEVVSKMGIDMLAVKRYLDPKILELNESEGAYNGHIPISLIFALTGCLLSTVDGSRYVVVANESSASIPHAEWHGEKVNHQWSKSLEFERMFQAYVHARISSELHYTSIIRPLTSVAVAKIFSEYPIYFETFTSDNSLFKIKQEERQHPRWSHDSPKSLSSYILLAPWMNDADLERTFGSNFLDKSELSELFLSLIGAEGDPILDCVGTPDELRLSLSLLARQNRMTNTKLMLLAIDRQMLSEDPTGPLQSALTLDTEQAMPDALAEKIIPLLTGKLS